MRPFLLLFCVALCLPLGGTVPASSSETITFSVASSASDKKLDGVLLLLTGSDGKLVELGHTDGNGRLAVSKDQLRQSGSAAILFCRERFFCGAFRLDDPKFLEADYRIIDLAPFAVP